MSSPFPEIQRVTARVAQIYQDRQFETVRDSEIPWPVWFKRQSLTKLPGKKKTIGKNLVSINMNTVSSMITFFEQYGTITDE